MNDAEEQFARRLADDLEHVLGIGIAIDDIELTEGTHGAHVRATLLVEGRIETVEADGVDILALHRPVIERAAELRLGAAFWRIVGPT
jgi:NaMN:DMB phosphoribosyltransferase